MTSDYLFNVVVDMYPSYIQCPILPHKAPHTTHVVPVIRVLIPPKAVDIRIKQVVDCRQTVEILAFVAFWAQAPREEQAEIAPRHFIRACISRVFSNIAA